MINWTRKIFGRAYRKCSSLSQLVTAPELVRELSLRGPSWTMPSHSLDECRSLLPGCVGLVRFEIGWLDWTELPPELASLTRLEEVACWNVPIGTFPYHLQDCPRLTRLVIRGGNLMEVTEEIYRFRCLSYLDLANNPLSTIPSNMKERLRLRFLQLHDTPVRLTIPPESHDSPRPSMSNDE